jgi:hypothetical protein
MQPQAQEMIKDPLTSKCQVLFVFDYDSPEEAEQGTPFTLRKQLCSS